MTDEILKKCPLCGRNSECSVWFVCSVCHDKLESLGYSLILSTVPVERIREAIEKKQMLEDKHKGDWMKQRDYVIQKWALMALLKEV